MLRLFVGLTLPEDVRHYLLSLQTGIRSARWQRDDQLHLTLKFIGEIPETTAADLDEALLSVHMPSFAIALAGAGTFGDRRKPRALWAGVEPRDRLHRLHEKIEAAGRRAGLPPEDRKFTPHVTLARFSGQGGAAAGVGAFLEAWGDLRTPPFAMRSFALFSSHLSPNGAIYRVEATYPMEEA